MRRLLSRARKGPIRRLFWLLLAAALISLSGCELPFDSPPTVEPTATSTPKPLPTATPYILNAEELYMNDDRFTGVTSPSYASFPVGAVLPPAPIGDSGRGVKVVLDAETVVLGELFHIGDQLQPGILILGADVSAWGNLPLNLSQAGFVVLVLRTGPLTPARQVETMLQSLIAISGVDAGVIGVIGEARAADIAMLGCAVNSLCDALALLSPTSRDTLLNMIPSLGVRPIWLSASRQDAESNATALALFQTALGEARFEEVDTGRGAALLQSEPNMVEKLVNWFVLQLHSD